MRGVRIWILSWVVLEHAFQVQCSIVHNGKNIVADIRGLLET